MDCDTLAAVEGSLRNTRAWLATLEQDRGFTSEQQAFASVCETLQTIRERLPGPEALALGLRLPLLLRGVFFAGWDPVPGEGAPVPALKDIIYHAWNVLPERLKPVLVMLEMLITESGGVAFRQVSSPQQAEAWLGEIRSWQL